MRRARHVRWNILIYGQGEKEFILLGQVILHPAWRAELKEKLAAGRKMDYIYWKKNTDFMMKRTGKIDAYGRGQKDDSAFYYKWEISSVYKKKDVPGRCTVYFSFRILEAAERIADRLLQIGNICSTSADTSAWLSWFELALDEGIQFIFLLIYGRRIFRYSESFRDLKRWWVSAIWLHVYAMETGLSSDPLMNRSICIGWLSAYF